MSKSRRPNFTVLEDRHLCSVFIHISQEVFQSREQFWKCVVEKYNSEKPSSSISDRSKKSLQCRMHSILKDAGKFNGCLQQIENPDPDGANEQLILDRANDLLMQQKGYASGFKFHHVWSVLKNYVQNQTVGGVSSLPEVEEEDIPECGNPSLSSLDINLSSDGGSSSLRPEELIKSKLKRKQEEDASALANSLKEENAKLWEMLINSAAKRDRDVELEMKRIEAKIRKSKIEELKRDDSILLIDLNTISDSERREFFRSEQQQIMQKRRQPRQDAQQNLGQNDCNGGSLSKK